MPEQTKGLEKTNKKQEWGFSDQTVLCGLTAELTPRGRGFVDPTDERPGETGTAAAEKEMGASGGHRICRGLIGFTTPRVSWPVSWARALNGD